MVTKAQKRIHNVTEAIIGRLDVAIGTVAHHRDGDGDATAFVIYAGYGEWLPCDGSKIQPTKYPELAKFCRDTCQWNGCTPDLRGT